jgi:hypothetical protein
MGSVVKKAGGLLGAAAGFAIGGPEGAALGAKLGGSMQDAAAKGEQSEAVKQAAATEADAARYAADIQRQMFERQVELQEPWRQAGVGALNKLIPLASEYTPFGMQQFQQDPGYAFRMSEGMKALERSAAARGGLLSGAQMKGVQRYGQDLASQEYQNAFDRYQKERSARLNPLQSLANVGQTSAQTVGGAAQQYGANIGNLSTSAATNQANALLAGAKLRASQYGGMGGALGDILGEEKNQNLLGKIFGGGGGGYKMQDWSYE